MEKKLLDLAINQRTTMKRVSKPLSDILDTLVPTKGGQRRGLTKADIQILSLMTKAGYEVDTDAWTLVSALTFHGYCSFFHSGCINLSLTSL